MGLGAAIAFRVREALDAKPSKEAGAGPWVHLR
jgi:hypothetical protein